MLRWRIVVIVREPEEVVLHVVTATEAAAVAAPLPRVALGWNRFRSVVALHASPPPISSSGLLREGR